MKLLDAIGSTNEFKRKFSFWELYGALVFIPRVMVLLASNNKSNLVSKNFVKRLHLAVTEVNGCPACSYQHTKMALSQGMSNEEISSFLSGGDAFIQPEEAKAIMFAQHFADSRGFPEEHTFEPIIKEYGFDQAEIIMAAVQVMIAGNIYGIPYSAFIARINGQKYKDSSLFYEIGMLLGGIALVPFAFIHGILRGLIGLPNYNLDKDSTAKTVM